MDDLIAQFTAITSATPERAAQYLQVADNDLEQAVSLFFESGGVDMGGSMPTPTTQPPTTSQSRAQATADDPIQIDSDDEYGGAPPAGAGGTMESDEAMARRLQEEMYGSGGAGGSRPPDQVDEEGVRAPIGRQAETLTGPYADWREDPDQMRAAIFEQMEARNRPRGGRPGIFNQQAPTESSAAVWNDNDENPDQRRQHLSRATGGASDQSSKSNMLAELFRPPFELMSKLRTWEGVRSAGKEEEKWILINIQEPNIFDCQVLNRDIWKDPSIQETVRENFIFKQYTKDEAQAADYIRFYFSNHESQDAYPHIAIVDPRTGEQVKVWSGVPAPKAPDFLMQLHEFLDRYSLKAFAKNPVAKRKAAEKKEPDVTKMSEEEMMEAAMKNSLGGAGGASSSGPRDADPDDLTRSEILQQKAQEAGTDGHKNGQTSDSPFAKISSSNPHEEPPQGGKDVTRIQFRHQGGRIVRRFYTAESVQRIYEWLKSSPIEGKEGSDFELIFMGKNLIDLLGQSIEEAGLKNGTVMVEFV